MFVRSVALFADSNILEDGVNTVTKQGIAIKKTHNLI